MIPKIPSLPEEYKLGWDTGFYFPWLGIPHNPKHKGCNFFLQYKISSEIGKKGNQYSYWSAPYYRFQIPYTTKENGNYVYDDFQYYSNIHKVKFFTDLTKNYDNFIELVFLLEGLLQRKIDLLTIEALNPYMKPKILKEAYFESI